MERHEDQLRVAHNAASRTIATILRHDARVTSYKLALIRAINDVVLSFPDAGTHAQPIAIPLRILAEYWVAYSWPCVDPRAPSSQGPHSLRQGVLANDMAFRPALAVLRRAGYPAAPRRAFSEAVRSIARSIEQPSHYAGPGEWGVFPRAVAYAALGGRAVGVPGTTAGDRCVVVGRGVWDGFLDLSLWAEALSIHEWSLFTESVAHPGGAVVRRGDVYTLLTDRPDNRQPLDWERNQVDLLLMEGRVFERPWTGRPPRATATWAARRPSSCPTAGCSRRITLRTSMECRMFLAQPSPVRSHAPWPG